MARAPQMGLQLEGWDEVQRALRGFPEKLARKHLKRAMAMATTPIVKKARELAPAKSGLLRKSITKKIKMYQKSLVVGIVGPKKGMGAKMGTSAEPAWYAHFTEGGVKAHTITAKGKRLAFMLPNDQAINIGSANANGFYARTPMLPDGRVLASSVKHPGVKAVGWLKKASDASRAALVGGMYTTLKNALPSAVQQSIDKGFKKKRRKR